MKIRAAAFLLALALAAPAVAQGGPTTDLAKLEGGHFALDKNHAKIIFSASHFGFSTYYGLFDDFDAKLTFDPKAPTKSTLEVTVNIDKVNTTNPKLDTHLKSPDFFDAAQFPTATYKATKIEVTGPAHGKITGDLTLRGVTKPVVLDVTFNGGGANPMTKAYVLGFNATGKIKRGDFGVKYGIPVIGEEVTLTISGEFDRVQ